MSGDDPAGGRGWLDRGRRVVVGLLLGFGWLGTVAAGMPAPAVFDFGAGKTIDDGAVQAFIEREGKELVEAGLTISQWGGQLEDRGCELALRRPGRRRGDVEELVRESERAVTVVGVFYRCPHCSRTHTATATGFFINSSGAMVTCLHVLADYRTNGLGMVALTRAGRLHGVRRILACDRASDLAVVQLEGERFPMLALGDWVAPGGRVHLISHPDSQYYTYTAGAVSRWARPGHGRGPEEYLYVTAEFARGSSGGPVMDDRGAVIGVVQSTRAIGPEAEREGHEPPPQMVLRQCIPVSALRKLVGGRG